MKKFTFLIMLYLAARPVFAEWEEFETRLEESVWASSSLSEIVKGKTVIYGPDALFDNRIETPWVEGAAGSGEGEAVTVLTQRAVTGMRISNGFAASEMLFSRNNRVKKARISLLAGFTAPGMVKELDSYMYLISEFPVEGAVELEDSRSPQYVPIPLSAEQQYEWYLKVLSSFMEEQPALFQMISEELEITAKEAEEPIHILTIMEIYGFFGLRITIEEVYRGSHWDDTCISEIEVDMESFF